MKIGFSTDSCNTVADVKARLALFESLACSAVEISLPDAVIVSEIYKQREGLPTLAGENIYTSIHAPAKIAYDDSEGSRKMLGELAAIALAINAKAIVVHPHMIQSFGALKALGGLVALENMDWRKPDARFPNELERYFKELPEAGLVIDMNHIYTHDKTMAMTSELWNRFQARVRHFHVSGFVSETQDHVPFIESHCDSIVSALPTLELPIILEIGASRLPIEQVRAELEYVKKLLASRY